MFPFATAGLQTLPYILIFLYTYFSNGHPMNVAQILCGRRCSNIFSTDMGDDNGHGRYHCCRVFINVALFSNVPTKGTTAGIYDLKLF